MRIHSPKFGRVLLKRVVEKVSKGGIIYTDAKKQSLPIGEVIEVGPTCDEDIKVGMIVYFGKFAGTWISDIDKTQELFIVQDEDILAEVEDI